MPAEDLVEDLDRLGAPALAAAGGRLVVHHRHRAGAPLRHHLRRRAGKDEPSCPSGRDTVGADAGAAVGACASASATIAR